MSDSGRQHEPPAGGDRQQGEQRAHKADEVALGERLNAARPVPGAEFRGALARHLAALDPGYGPRPAHLWAVVLALLGCALALLVVAALLAGGRL
jgi:hypothetical protein